MDLFTLKAKVELDVSSFEKAVKSATKSGASFGESVASSGEKAVSSFEATAKAASAADDRIQAMSLGSVQALSKLEKAVMKTENILHELPENFDGVVDAALNSANAVRQNAGMSLSQMKETIAGIGDALDAVDPASIMDREEIAESVKALEKYRDELEKMVKASEKAEKSSEKQEKASSGSGGKSFFSGMLKSLLTKEAILRAGRAVVGFFWEGVEAAAENSTDGAAFTSAIDELNEGVTTLKANLGEALLPTIISVASALNSLFPQKSSMEQYQDFIGGVQKSLSANLLSIDAGRASASQYISRLSELENKSKWSKEDANEWRANIDALLAVAPELKSYIDEQTYQIEGGTEALAAHAEAWYKDAEAQAKSAAMTKILTDAATKQAEALQLQVDYDRSWKEWQSTLSDLEDAQDRGDQDAAERLAHRARDLSVSTARLGEARDEANAAAEIANENASEQIGLLESVSFGLEAVATATDAASDAAEEASPKLQNLRESLYDQQEVLREAHRAVEDYASSVRQKMVGALDQTYDGFSKVNRIRPMSAKQQERNAEAQAEQLEEYAANLEKLKEMGIGDEFLAELSNGSAESMARAAGLANSSNEQIQSYIESLKELEEIKASVSGTMAENALASDEEYASLMEEESNALQTLYDRAEALQDFEGGPTVVVEDLASDVLEKIQRKMNALSGRSISISVAPLSGEQVADGRGRVASQRAVGIDSVPYDGFLASLHEGEAILTKAENRERNRRGEKGKGYDQPINLTVNINGKAENPYETAQEIRNALENMRWFS